MDREDASVYIWERKCEKIKKLTRDRYLNLHENKLKVTIILNSRKRTEFNKNIIVKSTEKININSEIKRKNATRATNTSNGE